MSNVKRCMEFNNSSNFPPPQPPLPREPIQILSNRLYSVEGDQGKCNDVIFTGFPEKAKYNIVFFHGDVSNYTELMCSDRDTQKLLPDYNLEEIGRLLLKRFNETFYPCHIWIIRVNKYIDNKFVVWSNFLQMNNDGQPNFSWNCIPQVKERMTAITQLQSLLQNAVSIENQHLQDRFGSICSFELPTILIGFSKGCVVLTKILYEINQLIMESYPPQNLNYGAMQETQIPTVIKLFRDIYWLDSSHNGEQELWPHEYLFFARIRQFNSSIKQPSYPTNYSTPQTQTALNNIRFHAYATPFQIGRPIKLRSCQEFGRMSDILLKLGVQHSSGYLLRGDEINLNTHFDILKSFPIKRR